MSERIKFILEHWKLGVHLLLRTKRFGVNNKLWSDFDSMFGYPMWKIILRIVLIYPLYWEWRAIKFRMKIGFISADTLRMLRGVKKDE